MDALLQGVTFDEKLAYQNVVSRRATFHYSALGEQLGSFVSDVVRQGGTPKGPYVYSLNNVPLDEITDIEFFLPIRESTFAAEEGTRFHSYFEVGPLAKGIVAGDFEHRTEQVYAQLLAALDGNGLEINAPFFHVLPEDGSKYASVYVGYVDPSEAVD
ncbi:DUF5085 family protein [Leifsonia shinshuensis]|uniref:Effector-binding domain-containing protein n=1 Tax=Leifsonia shinshuensis TaxID=150026 RepID=A0A853CXC6_9MICO|nr:DUF5085 family protein [Leifsonia shinshuensis]NYJ23205.1 effector-binding domain-containing protein [Leifsonia shinshuensis]